MTALWIFSPNYGTGIKLWCEEEKNHQWLLWTDNKPIFGMFPSNPLF